jgi:hypothetical protein
MAQESNPQATAAIQAAAAAAEVGLRITQAALDGIWKATGMADKPFVHAFYVDTIAAATRSGDCHNDLQDGDHICIYSTPKQATARNTEFHITLKQPDNTWWKALTAHRPPNTFSHEIAHVQDDLHENRVLLSYHDMLNYFIVLSKAKAFGVHANMYWIQNSYDLKPTHDWVISWNQD